MKKHFKPIITTLAMLLTFAAIAQTNVSGGIYTNTTWTKANSPYIVTDTVVVFPGVTLTIEPGVEVRFANSKRLEIRSANLIAEGTITDSITFTSNSSTPVAGSWSRIYLNPAIACTFKYCNFLYASNAIWCHFNNFVTTNLVSITNSVFRYNDVGLGYIYYTNVVVDNCLFRDNNYGIAHATGRVRMKNSIVTNNQHGILAPEFSSFRNCLIDSNSVYGLATKQGDSIMNCSIRYNGVGLDIGTSGGGGVNTLISNTIEFNTIGIQWNSQAPNVIYCNKICNNSSYDLESMISLNTNVFQNNYWCTNDSSTIASRIYDGYDNASVGLVFFMPIDTSQCYLTSCNVSVSVNNITNATCGTCTDGSATATVSGGTPPYIYTWNTSPLQTTQTATSFPSDTYTVCVSDANGCTACASVFVDSTNCTGFSVTTQATPASCSTCADGSASVTTSGGATPFSYTWFTNPIQTNDTATSLLPGSYVVCAIDANGCSVCDTVTVGTGNCSAFFDLYPDSIPHQYYAVNRATGSNPLTYIWSWGDGATDTAAFPSHTYAAAGLYTICLSITDAAGCTDSYCNPYYLLKDANEMIQVNVVDALPTAVVQLAADAAIHIYPNPADEILTIDFTAEIVQAEIKLYDVAGALQQVALTSGKQTTLHLDTLAAGIYLLEIRAGKIVSRKKVVLQ